MNVPIRGLFNLTIEADFILYKDGYAVSVPIRGLFNLTCIHVYVYVFCIKKVVSVPIRGLFNLTIDNNKETAIQPKELRFRPH